MHTTCEDATRSAKWAASTPTGSLGPCPSPSSPASPNSSRLPSLPSAAPVGRARTPWPKPCARRSPPANTWPSGGHRHRQVAGLPRARDPPRRREGHHRRHLHGHDRAAAPARRPRPTPPRQGAEAAARPDPDVRHPQGPPQLPVPQQAARRRREPADELFDPFQISAMGRAVKRIHEWADTTRTGDRDELVPGVPDSHVADGVGHRARVPRRRPSAPSARTASPNGRAPRPGGPTSSSPTTRSSPSTRWTGARCCPSTTSWWSTRPTSWSIGSPAWRPPSSTRVRSRRPREGWASSSTSPPPIGSPRRATASASCSTTCGPPVGMRCPSPRPDAVGPAGRGVGPAARVWAPNAGRSRRPRRAARSPRLRSTS